MFEIYSIGDAAFLTQILNAVAAMTGTGDFRQLVAVGLVVGIILGMFPDLPGPDFSSHLNSTLLCFCNSLFLLYSQDDSIFYVRNSKWHSLSVTSTNTTLSI
ncbi:hypothetical protein Thiowin_02520 [Thiorhodovibrio winogradskyi]|uniref:TraG N-terminal Proteobacteria domain-containing protein n=1 Tax=Thiorhodovibrio winogradskyi TaxID=77007 RepID=A0ABZ0SBT0_9GAMM|nr:conjugal transfer protein TraG N-terminal domain-containing protein [Thiorhodovibrio winogradskyi]